MKFEFFPILKCYIKNNNKNTNLIKVYQVTATVKVAIKTWYSESSKDNKINNSISSNFW